MEASSWGSKESRGHLRILPPSGHVLLGQPEAHLHVVSGSHLLCDFPDAWSPCPPSVRLPQVHLRGPAAGALNHSWSLCELIWQPAFMFLNIRSAALSACRLTGRHPGRRSLQNMWSGPEHPRPRGCSEPSAVHLRKGPAGEPPRLRAQPALSSR